MSRIVRAFWVVLTLPLLAASPATNATTNPTTNPATSPGRQTQVALWFAELAGRDPVERDAARLALMNLPMIDLRLLRVCVAARPASPAQADAVRDVVVHVLTREAVRSMPSNGLPYIGISHVPTADLLAVDDVGNLLPSGTVVEGVLPGAPAATALRVGDVILGVDRPDGNAAWITPTIELDRPQAPQLGEWVTACPPGEAMTFVVRRAGRVLRIAIKPEPRPLSLGGGLPDVVILAENARVDANRVFNEDWATLPGMSP